MTASIPGPSGSSPGGRRVVSRHPLQDPSYWQERLTFASSLEMGDHVPPSSRLSQELEHAFLAGLVAPADVGSIVGPALRRGTALVMAQALGARSTDFAVEVRHGDHVERVTPAGRLDWGHWLDLFSFALICGDEATLELLGQPDAVHACAAPPDVMDRFWRLLCAAFAALQQDDPLAASLRGQVRRERLGGWFGSLLVGIPGFVLVCYTLYYFVARDQPDALIGTLIGLVLAGLGGNGVRLMMATDARYAFLEQPRPITEHALRAVRSGGGVRRALIVKPVEGAAFRIFLPAPADPAFELRLEKEMQRLVAR